MATEYSVDNLLDFLAHASQRGLMPAATAQALAVACRNVFGILGADERADLRVADIDGVIKRFTNKRAKEFSPSSLKEYGRRVHRAVDLFLQWRGNPADFAIKTRATGNRRKKERSAAIDASPPTANESEMAEHPASVDAGGYASRLALRPGRVVTISNVPDDLTAAEAERLARFVRMLAAEQPNDDRT